MTAINAVVSILGIMGSYLIGSISFAVIVSKIMKLPDPRRFGSRNPGATNVLRSGNKLAAVITLIGDALKGWIAVELSLLAVKWQSLPTSIVSVCAVAVFLGHIYPVFFSFKGGKGVATAIGVLIGINPWLALATVATWLIIVYTTRYSSLAAIVAAIFAPLYYLLGSNVAWPSNSSFTMAIFIISSILLFKHSSNISRLLNGTEPRVGSKLANQKVNIKK